MKCEDFYSFNVSKGLNKPLCNYYDINRWPHLLIQYKATNVL